MEFKDKTIIVTGAGQGIGLEVCRQLIAAGGAVVLNDIEERLTREAVAALSETGPGLCIGYHGNAADAEVIDGLINAAIRMNGHEIGRAHV